MDKVMVTESGERLPCRLGLTDKQGALVYLLDTGEVKRFEYHPMSWIVQDIESELEHMRSEKQAVEKRLEKALAVASKYDELCQELFADGRFTKGYKGPFKTRHSNLVRKAREIEKEGR